MHLTEIRELVRVAIAIGGALGIFCGYKLFCSTPFGRNRGVRVIHGVSGAILALFGMAVLMLDVRGSANGPTAPSHHTIRQASPAEAGSFVTPGIIRHKSTGDWAI